ncbi:actin-related protein 2/3 complex subunit [Thraustotheca clavata]|uniref:Arp2/3 complex 34 kDa subunit n=1 Tax=Thraustotheca clavata TaxID=74557 RepID=A0A1W0A2W7_9STRA|nr:actin-related protein 2/3 complex subunit [Thraustotheca clavata]
MIFLEDESKIVQEVLQGRLGETAPRPVDPLEIRLCDFDDVQYDISIQDNNLAVSMSYPPFVELVKFGAANMLANVYPEFTLVAPKPGFELKMVANVDAITPENATDVINRIAMLKRNLLSAPFDHCFLALHAGQSSSLSPIQIPFRRQESIYVLPQADRIVIVFSIAFQDKTDQAIARVFLQEFAEARRHVNNAPPVSFGKDPPLELRGVPDLRPSPDHVGYLSFAIFPSHIASDAKRAKACTLVQGFRNYLHYHIKASKTYLHIRMRKRVDLLLQVLNRAQPAKDPSKVTKKTITGKTFDRKV